MSQRQLTSSDFARQEMYRIYDAFALDPASWKPSHPAHTTNGHGCIDYCNVPSFEVLDGRRRSTAAVGRKISIQGDV